MGESAGVYESSSSQMAMRCTASTPSAPTYRTYNLLSVYNLPQWYKALEETVSKHRVKLLQRKLRDKTAAETAPFATDCVQWVLQPQHAVNATKSCCMRECMAHEAH
jgi:hypothetical protein